MSKSHIDKLTKTLESSKWHVISDYNENEYVDFWMIARPNGSNVTKLNFSICGNGYYGDHIGNETIYNATDCSVENHSNILLKFGKYTKNFQKEVILFVEQLNTI